MATGYSFARQLTLVDTPRKIAVGGWTSMNLRIWEIS
jgi:hypothetical protein